MKHNRNNLSEAIRLGLGFGALASMAITAAPAFAQDQDQEDDASETTDRVQVTGTRILSPILTSSSPITEIAREEIQFTGTTRIEDLVGQYPQASATSDSFTVNPTSGFPSVSLRGMGTNRTLTLVNGRRLPPGGIRSEARDLNQIPAALVSRVEILTGGASAVYGSDAMAGVVNFVLDTEYTGFSAQAGYSAYMHDNSNDYMQGLMDRAGFDYPTGTSGPDGESRYVDITAGGFFGDGRGHAMGWVTYRENDTLLQGQRDHSSCALNGPGTACGGSSTAPNPNFLAIGLFSEGILDSFWVHRDPETGTWLNELGELYNYAPINHYQRPDKRWTFGTSIRYDVNDRFQPYFETMFANTNNDVQIAESGTFFVNDIPLTCDLAFLGSFCSDLGIPADAEFTVAAGKRNVEGGPRISSLEASNFRIVSGFEGQLNDSWSYDVSFLQARNASTESSRNDYITSRLEDSLLLCPPGSASGCVPYDVWSNNITPEAAEAQGGIGMRQGRNNLQVFSAFATGELGFALPAADGIPLSMVAGYEWRRETYERVVDANQAAGVFAGGGGPRPSLSGEIRVNEFFTEAAIPVIANRGIIDSFAFDLGYRYSDYSTSGAADTWKIGFASQIAGDYRVRGGFNRAIRAANTGELFAQQQIALWSGQDPCAGPNPAQTAAQCANTGVSAAQYGNVPDSPANQYNQFVGGNEQLDPEVADTWTIGVVATPIDGLQVALDYWQIDMTDRIGSIGAQNIVNFCGLSGDSSLCSLIRRRAGSGDLWAGSDPNASGLIFNGNNNFGDLDFRGLDLNVNHRMALGEGMLFTSLAGSYFLKQETAPLPGVNEDATFDCAGIVNTSCQTPNWRHVVSSRYSVSDFTISARWRMVGRMNYRNNDGSLATTDRILVNNGNRVGSYHFYDLSGSYRFAGNYEVTVGLNNVFDKAPPLVGSTLSLNGNALGGYDQLGRFFYTSVRIEF
jgi:outer membrane receptor protein involved in Fe transport